MAGPDTFDVALRFVLRQEGVVWDDHGRIVKTGYVNNPADPGGETNFGISKAAYPALDIKNLSYEQARDVYKAIWDHWKCQDKADGWALFTFDAAVQHSPAVVTRFLYHNQLRDALWDRIRYYLSLSTFHTFGRGWMYRMANLRDVLDLTYGVPI